MKFLIFGGTGTIGKALLKYFDKYSFEIIVASRDEYKQAVLKKKYPSIKTEIVDVRDYGQVENVIVKHAPNYVIFAAAMKRIEKCEEHPLEAVKTNIMGAENVAKISKLYGVEKFVAISTDKAVKPINVYGMTKSVQEKIVTTYGYNCVRYGNVFGSRGSAVELFDKQAKDGIITLTDSRMTRFFITTQEAVELIFNGLFGNMGGHIYIPFCSRVRMLNLAEAFAELEDGTVTIKNVGVSSWEKIHEVLIAEEEIRRSQLIDGYIRLGNEPVCDPAFDKEYISETNALEGEFYICKEELKTMITEWRENNGH